MKGIRLGVLSNLGRLIHVKLTYSYPVNVTPVTPDGVSITPMLDIQNNILERLLHVLIEHTHSLRYVSIEFIGHSGPCTPSRGSWRIVRSDKERTVERISQYDAEQIREIINARDFDPASFI